MRRVPNLGSCRCLVVESDRVLRERIERLLGRWGATVDSVCSGSRAITQLRLLREQDRFYDLVLVAAGLAPDEECTDGFVVFEEMARFPAQLAHTVVLFDANPRSDELVRARNLGVGHYLTRPLESPRLVKTILAATGTSLESPADDAPVRILLAEDSSDIRILFRMFLEPGCEVENAENGAVAVELYRFDPPDLVLMDIQMPGFDGYSAIERIRSWEREHSCPRVPVVAVTAYPETESPQKSMRSGFDGYLPKPVSGNQLRAAVERLTRRALRRPGSGRELRLAEDVTAEPQTEIRLADSSPRFGPDRVH